MAKTILPISYGQLIMAINVRAVSHNKCLKWLVKEEVAISVFTPPCVEATMLDIHKSLCVGILCDESSNIICLPKTRFLTVASLAGGKDETIE